MSKALCGIECNDCPFNTNCKGCAETNGSPFGGSCVLARCCQTHKLDCCSNCANRCQLKEQLLADIRALGIPEFSALADLNMLIGKFVSLEYELANGQKIKLLNDNDIYFANQVEIGQSKRYYGVAANEAEIIVSTYGEGGIDPQLVLYKRRNL